MAPPLQQPRAEGAGSRGRDEDHAALVSSRKRPRVVAETHDDSVAFARAASLRASDYGAWLSESKTRWRSLRKKLALVRNFVELEANGDSLELGGILDPTGARARDKKKKRGFSRWKTTRAEEVRVGDIPQLTGDFKRLLAMLEANPATGGRAPTGDDGKETARAAGAGADANDDAFADDDAGASRFAFEGERLEDSDDDLSSESSESDDSGDDDAEDADESEDRPEEEGDDKSEDRVLGDAEAEVGVGVEKEKEKGVPERSAADALAAYGDIDPPPPPPPTNIISFASPQGGFVNPHPAVARESRATLATLMPPPPPQPQAPRAATSASGAAGALAAYGFDETPVFPQAPFVTQAPIPPPSLAHAHAAVTHGSDARAGAFEDPWRIPAAAGSDFADVRRAARDDASLHLREGAPRVARVSGSLQGHSLNDTARPFAMDDELRAAAALCAKPWLDLSVGDVETVLAQVKYLISRRRRAHKQGRAERRKRRLVSRAAETVRAAAAAATGTRTVDGDASTDPERAGGSGSGSGSRPAGVSGPFRLPDDRPSADLSGSPPLHLASAARHTCVACDRVFDMPHKLRDHMHEHAGTAPHRCPFPGCARAFANRSSLARHRLLHEKRHSCAHPGCGRHFPTAWALRTHERSHSEDRPFLCEVPGCGKRFKDEYTLVTHARVHTGEKRFACGDDGEPGCGKRFGYKVDLKRHRERCAVARGDE